MHTLLRVVVVSLGLLVLVACNETYRPSSGCTSDDECVLGRVCSSEGRCEDPSGADVGGDAEGDADEDTVDDVGFDVPPVPDAQSDAGPDVQADAPPPVGVLAIRPAAADFGEVPVGEERELSLRVENIGVVDVSVDGIESSAGSFRVDDALPATLAPGAFTFASVVTKGDEPGATSSTITVFYDGDREASASVLARFVPDDPTACLLFNPPTSDVGEVLVGERFAAEAELINCGIGEIEYEVVGSALPAGVVLNVVDRDRTLEAGEAVIVRLEVDTDGFAPGGFRLLVSGNGEGSARASWNVTGSVVGAVIPQCVEPLFGDTFDLGRVQQEPGGVARLDAEFRNCGAESLRIDALLPTAAPELSFAVPAGDFAPGEVFAVSVVLDRSNPGAFGGSFTLQSAAGTSFGPYLVTGQVIPVEDERCVEVIPTSVVFEDVQVGERAEARVEFFNCGEATLTPASLGFAGRGPFTATWDAIAPVPPFGSLGATIGFAPSAAGRLADTLSVTFDPLLEADVPIVGTAVPAPIGALLTLNPPSVVFGEVANASIAEAFAIACNEGDQPLELQGAEVAERSNVFDVEDVRFPLAPGECVDVVLTFAPQGVPAGDERDFSGVLIVDSSVGSASVPVSGVGVGEDIVVERCLQPLEPFREVFATAGAEVEVEVPFVNCGTTPLFVADAFAELDAPFPAAFSVSALDGLSDEGTLGVGDVVTVRVRFGATREGEYLGFVIVAAAGADDPLAELLFVVVDDLPERCIEVSPLSLNFGRPGIGAAVTREVVVSNCGAADLVLNEPTLSFGTQGFEILDPAERILGPGEATSVTVFFSSEREGSFGDTLVIRAEDVGTERVSMRAEVEEVSFCPTLDAGASTSIDGPFRGGLETGEGNAVYLDSGYPFPDVPGVEFTWELVEFDGVRPPERADTSTPGRIRLSDTQLGTYVYTVRYASSDGCNGEDIVEVRFVENTGVGEGIRVVISWRTPGDDDEFTDPGSDVDLHVARRNRGLTNWNGDDDCYYANQETDWGVPGRSEDNGRLLRDEVNGIGPEIMVLEQPAEDEVFLVGIYYFSASGLGPSDVTLRIFRDGVQQVDSTRRLEETGDTWLAAEIRDGGDTITLLGGGNYDGFPPSDAP